FATKPSDDLDAESSRSTVLSGAALGHDPATIKQYVAASAHWRDVPQTRRRQVLVFTADNQPGFATKLIAEIPAEKNPTLRNDMILSLISTRQPKVIEEALPLLLESKVDIHESTVLLYAQSNEPVRAEVEKFYLAHAEELAKRFGEDVESGAIYAEVGLFTAACDPRRRDEIVAAIAPFAKKPGAERVVAQATEGLDQCIATRTVLEPEIREWLDSVKLGK
ncbi:MAG TPA: ERAP1-like C-terminal domain-containing protein, partial [Kofleriaceae bacterium]